MAKWNPWHGCHKYSAGCQNCYVYRMDAMYDRDSSLIKKTKTFSLPLLKNRKGEYKLQPPETVYTCFSSDFFVEDADRWRIDAWEMIRQRSDLHFLIITKRIDRFSVNLPEDWADGYDHVTIGCTIENQDRANARMPLFKAAPIKHKILICEPLLSHIDLTPYLDFPMEGMIVGGESGQHARICEYSWVLSLRKQAENAGIPFCFKQTGAFFKKDGKVFHIPRRYQHIQAQKANINWHWKERKEEEKGI